MKRDFLTEQDKKILDSYMEKERRLVEKTNLREEYIDYDEKYDDYFREEIVHRKEETNKKLYESLADQKSKHTIEWWNSKKFELYLMIDEGMWDKSVIPVIELVDRNVKSKQTI